MKKFQVLQMKKFVPQKKRGEMFLRRLTKRSNDNVFASRTIHSSSNLLLNVEECFAHFREGFSNVRVERYREREQLRLCDDEEEEEKVVVRNAATGAAIAS